VRRPLERERLVTILRPMLRDRLLLGLWIGLIAAAATAGALVGFGWVRGTPVQPLNTLAHIVLGSRAFQVRSVDPAVTTAGIAVHVLSLVAWGMLFSLTLARARGARAWAVALLFAALVAVFDFVVVPERLSPGLDALLTRGELVVLYGVMAVAMGSAARLLDPHSSVSL
jgi:hypothetical protein